MSLVTIIPPATEPVSLEMTRLQCKCGAEEDALLALYIQSAREWAEDYLNRALTTQTVEQRLDAFPAGDIKLLKAGAQSIVSITYTDATGADQVMPGTAYVLDPDASPAGWVLRAAGTSWPATAPVINAVRVRYLAGYGDATAVPANIRLWMLAMVVLQYEQRSPVVVGATVAGLPDRYTDRLLDFYRVYL